MGVCPGVQRVGPRLLVEEGSIQVSYPDNGHAIYADIEGSSYWFAHRNAMLIAVIRRYPPGGPIFDVGGGNGFVSLALDAAKLPSIVVEPGDDGVRLAVNRGLVAIKASLHSDLFYPGSVDAIGLFDVIEHIADDVQTFRTLSRVLKPGGRIYVTTPAYPLLWSEEDRLAGQYRRYTRAALRRMLKSVGFEIEYISNFFAALVLPVFALRSLPSLFGRRSRQRRDVRAEHQLPSGLIGTVLKRSLDWELASAKRGRRIAIGTSKAYVARLGANVSSFAVQHVSSVRGGASLACLRLEGRRRGLNEHMNRPGIFGGSNF
jgi:SAM-dependent methyltransferase